MRNGLFFLCLVALLCSFVGCDESDQGGTDKSGWTSINNGNGYGNNGNNGSGEIVTQLSDLLKSGTRLKHYVWKGDDGAQMINSLGMVMFDTVLEKDCKPTSFESYGCDLAYCVPDGSSFEINNEFGINIFSYCIKAYDDSKYDSTVSSGYYPQSLSLGVSNGGIYNDTQLYSDPSCNNRLTGNMALDDSCYLSKDSFVLATHLAELTPYTRICIDGSERNYDAYGGAGPITTYYRPSKDTKLKTAYAIQSGTCRKFYDSWVSVDEVKSLRTEDKVKTAREWRNRLCANVCNYIEQKATAGNWAVIRKDIAD